MRSALSRQAVTFPFPALVRIESSGTAALRGRAPDVVCDPQTRRSLECGIVRGQRSHASGRKNITVDEMILAVSVACGAGEIITSDQILLCR
jgi:hypothetical protein